MQYLYTAIHTDPLAACIVFAAIVLASVVLFIGVKLMSAIDNLTTAVQANTTAVNDAVAKLAEPHPSDAAIQSAADSITANTERLAAAVAAA